MHKFLKRTSLPLALVITVSALSIALGGISHAGDISPSAEFGSPEYFSGGKKVPTTVAIPALTPGEAPRAVTRMSGVQYYIPVPYLDYPVRPDADEDFLLAVEWPTVKPWKSGKKELQSNVMVLVRDAKQTISFQFRLGKLMERMEPVTLQGERFGLKLYSPNELKNYIGTRIEPTFTVNRGNEIIASPTTQDWADMKGEVYTDTEKNSTQLSTYINCNGDTHGSSPGCSMHFVDDDLLYEVTFRKIHLADWQKIRSAMIDLVQGFKQRS